MTSTQADASARRWLRSRLAYAQGWDGELSPAMAAFRVWALRYASADPAARAQLEPEGVALARLRRPEMLAAIETDPQHALAVTLPAPLREILPAAVLAQVEARIAGTGDLAVQCMLAAASHADEQRVAFLGGVTYAAHVYGRRQSQLTKYNASLHGVALDGCLALHESPLRLLEADESPQPNASSIDPVTGVAFATPPKWIEAHNRAWPLADESEIELLESRLNLAEEASGGPQVAPLLLTTLATADPPRAANAATAWTTGVKKILILRVAFSDRSAEPVAEASAVAVMNQSVAPFFEQNSYGKTSLVTTVSIRTYLLPRTFATYVAQSDYRGVYADAIATAAADYPAANYDRVAVVFTSLGSLYHSNTVGAPPPAGVADIGGSRVWIDASSFNFGAVAHELGHTYGVNHANQWPVYNGSPISVAFNAASEEYGDVFDIMGGGAVSSKLLDARQHFSMWAKNRLGWLPDSLAPLITQSGTYRIYRYDHADALAANQPLALRIAREGVYNYWIGLRGNFFEDQAYVIWGAHDVKPTQLLQIGGAGAQAPLPIGRSFTDSIHGITIRPLAAGGTAPARYLDVSITMPATPPGVIAAWGTYLSYPPNGLTGVTSVAANGSSLLALKADGTVTVMHTSLGVLAQPTGVAEIRSIAIGRNVFGAVKNDGTVLVWRSSSTTSSTMLPVPSGINNVRQLALGDPSEGTDYALAVRNDGTVVSWGNNGVSSPIPAGLRDVVSVAIGDISYVAVKADGTMVKWDHVGLYGPGAGPTYYLFPANATGIVAVAGNPIGSHSLALKNDGTVIGWGSNFYGQCDPPAGLTNVIAIAVGDYHSLALKADGTLVAWGADNAGQAAAPLLPHVVGLACASQGSFALMGAGPRLTTEPKSQSLIVGGRATFNVAAQALGAITYQWRKDGVPLAGATNASLTVASATLTDAGFYDAVITSNGIAATSRPARLEAVTPIVIASQPRPQTLWVGATTSLSVTFTGGGAVALQWRKNGVAIAGATGSTLTLNSVSIATTGVYDVVLKDSVNTVISAPADLVVTPVSRIANLSILTNLPSPGSGFTVGTVIGGPGTSGTKRLLVRAAGPALTPLGVPSALADPKLELFRGSTSVGSNDDWFLAPAPLGPVFSDLGAFAFSPSNSKDSALLANTLTAGGYSVQISGVGSATGAVLAEIYDATPAGSMIASTPRLINVSVLKEVNAGEILTAGFVIDGTVPKPILVRAVGPTLATAFNLSGVISDPKLDLFRGSARIDGNDDWNGSAALAAAFINVGAFALPANSKDAALLTTLQPGAYTVQITGGGDNTGLVIVEVYEVP